VSLQVVKSSSGRSSPLNAGAKAAKGKVLLFLHADLALPPEYDIQIEASMKNNQTLLGAFRFGWNYETVSQQYPTTSTTTPGCCTRLLQWFMPHLPDNVLSLPLPAGFIVSEYLFDWRGRLFLRPEGDQALFVRREDFVQIGGFLPDHCCMEDYEFVGRLRAEAFRTGRTIDIVPGRVGASPRREMALGALFTSTVNLIMYLLYDVCWFHPTSLFKLYYHPWSCYFRAKIS